MEGEQRRPRAIGYARVSTVEQSQEGISMDVQRAKIEAYCALHGLELVGMAEDAGISGKNFKDRPGIRAALDRLDAGEADALVILKIDRLSRSTKDVLNLVEQVDREGWALHSITERLDTATAAGRFVLTILAALSQMEREQIGERTSMALQEKRRRGERLGTTPFGYTTVAGGGGENELRPDPAEQDVLDRIRAMRAGGLPHFQIAKRLNAEGVPTKRGGRWHAASVSYIVRHTLPRLRPTTA
jgi:DNA invertase Pin-like site-specific DNA recombinase